MNKYLTHCFEEAGSNPVLKKTYIQGRALVEVMGRRVGTRFSYGTGGDAKYMNELADMFNNPTGFSILPYKHNYTKSGEYILSGFFVPAFTILTYDGHKKESTIDSRGVTNIKKAKEYYERGFNALLGSPKDYLRDRAEFCFTPEDAFAFEGDNLFNTVLLAELQAAIKLLKKGPKELIGNLEYVFRDNKHIEEMVEGVKFVEDAFKGHVHIIEAPVTNDLNKIPANLYVAGIDGIDMGNEDTSATTKDPSSFAVVIMKRSFGLEPPKIVAYYKDRPDLIKTAHLTCLKLLLYYNARACLESTRISILLFFRERKCVDKYLMRRPRSCQADIQNGRSRQIGAPASESVIKHQLELIADYIDEFCQEIWFIDIIEELLKYSYANKTKFDLVAALGMCLLANEELMFVKPKVEVDQSSILQPFGFWTDERGIKHKGVIPNNLTPIPKFNLWPTLYYDAERPRTSDPRINSDFIL